MPVTSMIVLVLFGTVVPRFLGHLISVSASVGATPSGQTIQGNITDACQPA